MLVAGGIGHHEWQAACSGAPFRPAGVTVVVTETCCAGGWCCAPATWGQGAAVGTLRLFDEGRSPVQGVNLERALGIRVMDRTEVILDIFATRARSHEAKLQVELAQLEYLLPRLTRMWTHLSRIRGGIGLRG